MFIRNPILATDSYKGSHFQQYPKGTTGLSSYMTARGTKEAGVNGWVYYGGNFFIKDVLEQRVTHEHIEEAAVFYAAHGIEFNRKGWTKVVEEYNGRYPVQFDAVPEGTYLPFGVPGYRMEIVDDEDVFFLVSHLESLALSYTWYGSTIVTDGLHMKAAILRALRETSTIADESVNYKVHDFGFRGVIPNGGYVGGSGHLVNFLGTDTMEGMLGAMQYYNADLNGLGHSIPASEHSTMTSWGREREYEAYENMVNQYAKPGAMFAMVIDSYDTMGAIDLVTEKRDGVSLLDRVRDAGATVVLRPDSGDPVYMPVDVIRQLIFKLDDISHNDLGYTVLPSYVRVIQGDGIGPTDIIKILNKLKEYGISGDNIAFGMGGGLLQKVNRDKYKMAQKASAIQIDGQWHDVVKDPKTDPTKKSKGGRLVTVRDRENNGQITVITLDEYHADIDEASLKGVTRYQTMLFRMFDGTKYGNGSCNKYLNDFSEIRRRVKYALSTIV